jgi:hypothetical protein
MHTMVGLAYFVSTVSYARKLFMKSTTGKTANTDLQLFEKKELASKYCSLFPIQVFKILRIGANVLKLFSPSTTNLHERKKTFQPSLIFESHARV